VPRRRRDAEAGAPLNDLSASALQEYEKKWRSELEPELQRGLLLRKFFERLSDGQIDTLSPCVERRPHGTGAENGSI